MSLRKDFIFLFEKINSKMSGGHPDKKRVENLVDAFTLVSDDLSKNRLLINNSMNLLTRFFSSEEFQVDILEFMKTKAFDIPFYQGELIKSTLDKSWEGVHLDKNGTCFGIATQYINYEKNGRGDEYIKYLNKISSMMNKTVSIHGDMTEGSVANIIKHYVPTILWPSLKGIFQSQTDNIYNIPFFALDTFMNKLEMIDSGVPKYMLWASRDVPSNAGNTACENIYSHSMVVKKNENGTYDVMDPNQGCKKGVGFDDVWITLFLSTFGTFSNLKKPQVAFTIMDINDKWRLSEGELPALNVEDVSRIVLWKGKGTDKAKSKKLIADLSKENISYFFEIIHADGTRQEIGVNDIDPNLNLKFNGELWNKIDNDLDALIGNGVKKSYFIKEKLLNETSLRGGDWPKMNWFDKIFGLGGDGEGNWTHPSNEDFIKVLNENETSAKPSKYDRNLIVQLHSEDTVNESILKLFGKHPEQSALLLLDPDNKNLNVLLWDNEANDFRISSIADWLTLDSEGMIRIQLVGHGVTKEGKTTLGGLDVAQLQQAIHPVLELLAKSGPHLKGLKISLVGCETLPAGGALEQSLPAQLLQSIHNQLQQLELKDVALELTSRELQIGVNDDGHKLVNIDGKWVSKEVANLLGKQHKITLLMQDGQVVVQAKSKGEVLALIKDMQALKPLSADETALLEKIRTGLQENIRGLSGERHDKNTTKFLIKLDELLQLKEEVNDIFDLLQKSPELRDFKPTLEIDKMGHVAWIGAEGEKKYTALDREQHAKVEQLAKQTQQLLSDFQRHVSLDSSGNITLKNGGQPSLDQVEGGAVSLNAAFLLDTLIGKNPFNQGLDDNVTLAMKIQTYSQLIQNSMGVVHDVTKVADLYINAAQTNFNLANKLIGVCNTFCQLGGVMLDLVNISSSVAQVCQAKNEYEKELAITNLVGNVIPAGISTAALAASLIGATTSAAVLGMVGAPIAGLAFGITSLIQEELGFKDNFNRIKKQFDTLLLDYKNSSDTKDISGSTLVVNSVNFKNSSFSLGDAEASEFYDDNRWAVNIYEGFGYNPKDPIKNESIAESPSFVLPGNLNVIFKTYLNMLLGSYSPDGCEAFKILHQKFGDKFDWIHKDIIDTQVLNSYDFCYKNTAVTIELDSKNRTLVMPTIVDDSHREKLRYILIGGGGNTTLSVSPFPINVTIKTTNSIDESWTIDISNQIKEVKVENDSITMTEHLFSGIEQKIKIQSNQLSIGTQCIHFDGNYRPKNLYLTSQLAMISPTGEPVISQFSSDKNPLGGRLVMQIDLFKQQVISYSLFFDSPGDAVASLRYLQKTLCPLVKTGLISLGLKTGESHGFLDLELNRGSFLNKDTGVLTYLENGVISEQAVFKQSDASFEKFMGGRESGYLHYTKDGVYLTRNIFIFPRESSTVTSKVKMENGGVVFQTEMVSLSKASFSFFEEQVLKKREPLTNLAKLFDRLSEAGKAKDPVTGATLGDAFAFLHSPNYVNFTGHERIFIENARGQKMEFEYDETKQCMKMNSAVWNTSEAAFIYKLFPDAAYLHVQGMQGINVLVIKDEDINIDYSSADTTMVLKVSKTTQKISIPTTANKYKEIIINGSGDNLSIYIGGVGKREYGLMWDGLDLIICTAEKQQIRITNAWDVKTLQLGVSDELSVVDKLSCWARQNQLHDIIASQFSREKHYGEYEIGSVRYFSGESGLQYKMTGEEVRAIGYVGKEAFTLPEQGLRSLHLLENILSGNTLFTGRMYENVTMDKFFPEKGQAAINILAMLESGDKQSLENVTTHIFEKIKMMGHYSWRSLAKYVLDFSKSIVDVPCLPQESPIVKYEMPTRYHLEKLVMAMNSLVEPSGIGEEIGKLGMIDPRGGGQLALVH
ncbi:hypothetical protein H9X98_22850 [Aeromonas jandaei]|uniref:TcdA/TcdB pore-forming domain-containing protein n=1 Tax=Aeromonas jandaei TaxID=650 RepID=UPI001F40D02F|nr:TcdA/TcdB pore-forming domain-containing protein [Aeromonas jandaei]MCF7720492.1 hypothetical protein [Aeromonas jandaei]